MFIIIIIIKKWKVCAQILFIHFDLRYKFRVFPSKLKLRLNIYTKFP